MNGCEHVAVPYQVGNTCGPHSVMNAYMALGMNKPDIDMHMINVDSRWIKLQIASNENPKSITVLESYSFVDTPSLMQHFIDHVYQRAGSVETDAKLDIALIINMLPTKVIKWLVIGSHFPSIYPIIQFCLFEFITHLRSSTKKQLK